MRAPSRELPGEIHQRTYTAYMGAAASSLRRPVYLCHQCTHKFFPEECVMSINNENNENSDTENEEDTTPSPSSGPTCPRCGSDFLELGRAIDGDVADAVRAAAANGIPMVGGDRGKESGC